MLAYVLHPNEVVMVQRGETGLVLPTKAFSAAVADLCADTVNRNAKRDALAVQIARQKAPLNATEEVMP